MGSITVCPILILILKKLLKIPVRIVEKSVAREESEEEGRHTLPSGLGMRGKTGVGRFAFLYDRSDGSDVSNLSI